MNESASHTKGGNSVCIHQLDSVFDGQGTLPRVPE